MIDNNEKLRAVVADFLEENMEKIKLDLVLLRPKERARLYCALLQYGLPRLRSVKSGIDFSQMSEAQLDKIINDLRESIINQQDGK